jgi:DNA-binding XRE family transcriptional regulator
MNKAKCTPPLPVPLSCDAVRRARGTVSVTKRDLAAWLGMSEPTYYRLEAGDPDTALAKKLATIERNSAGKVAPTSVKAKRNAVRSAIRGHNEKLGRVLEAIRLRGPVPAKDKVPRAARAFKLPPEWLVLMRDLAEFAEPEDASVRAFLETVEAMLGSDVGGLNRASYTSTAKLFDARIAVIAETYPRWLEALIGWLERGAAINAHPWFPRMARRAGWARVAIDQGVKPSEAFGLVGVGRPAGAARPVAGVRTYIGTGATQNNDAVRLAYLHTMTAILEAEPRWLEALIAGPVHGGVSNMHLWFAYLNRMIAIFEAEAEAEATPEAVQLAALTCYGNTASNGPVVVSLKIARATGAAEISPSDIPVLIEIAAIKNKYNPAN